MGPRKLKRLFRRDHVYHVVFGVALTTLIALGSWWFLLVWTQVKELHSQRLELLELRGRDLAQELGRFPAAGPPPTVAANGPFELVPYAGEAGAYPLGPNRPHLALRPKAEATTAVESKFHRRTFMVFGEGSLLMLLILVCFFMLYRLLLSERRARAEVETFFQAVSHELKTPVAGVHALLETVSSGRLSEEELARYARLGLKESTRLQRLIENVLLANRIGGESFAPRPRPVRFVELAKRHVERRGRIFIRQPVSLENTCEGDPAVWADPALLVHVLDNLIANAFKYGGDEPEVTLRLREDDAWGIIEVQDTGLGLRPDESDIIFEKFERGAAGRVAKSEGSGLGLFIARNLVESFGGEVAAASAGPGRGSVFTVKLKRVPDDDETTNPIS